MPSNASFKTLNRIVPKFLSSPYCDSIVKSVELETCTANLIFMS